MNEKKKKSKLMIYISIMIVLVIAFIGVIGNMIYDEWRKQEQENTFQEMRPKITTEAVVHVPSEDTTEGGGETIAVTYPKLELDWDAILAQNEDIYAWIYIPNTNVNYPILQHPSDNSYYLEHNMDGSRGYPGCIYTELENKKDFTDHLTVIYGHNMKNGTMFRSLHNYEEDVFFKENPYAYIYLPDGTVHIYEIFWAGTYSSEHLLKTYGSNAVGLHHYLKALEEYRKMETLVRDDLDVRKEDHVIVLSTCIGNQDSVRYFVQAVETNVIKAE